MSSDDVFEAERRVRDWIIEKLNDNESRASTNDNQDTNSEITERKRLKNDIRRLIDREHKRNACRDLFE